MATAAITPFTGSNRQACAFRDTANAKNATLARSDARRNLSPDANAINRANAKNATLARSDARRNLSPDANAINRANARARINQLREAGGVVNNIKAWSIERQTLLGATDTFLPFTFKV
jgi:hypothetical protein